MRIFATNGILCDRASTSRNDEVGKAAAEVVKVKPATSVRVERVVADEESQRGAWDVDGAVVLFHESLRECLHMQEKHVLLFLLISNVDGKLGSFNAWLRKLMV